MPATRLCIIHNLDSGGEIKRRIESSALADAFSSVSSNAEAGPHRLIDAATHFVVVLTEDSVTPGEESLEHLERALETRRPIEFIFKPPFFEAHKWKAPASIQQILNNHEAIQFRELEYEIKVVCSELAMRLMRGVPPPAPQAIGSGTDKDW